MPWQRTTIFSHQRSKDFSCACFSTRFLLTERQEPRKVLRFVNKFSVKAAISLFFQKERAPKTAPSLDSNPASGAFLHTNNTGLFRATSMELTKFFPKERFYPSSTLSKSVLDH